MTDIQVANCQYYSIDQFNSLFRTSNDSMIILLQNIRSFQSNSEEFLSFISQINRSVDVLILTETWFSPCLTGSIDGYIEFHSFRDNRVGGGVSIYVRSDLDAKCNFRKANVTDFVEHCLVDIFFSCGFAISFLSIYRPPNPDIASFCDELLPLLEEIKSSDITFICGDLNIDLLNPQNSETDFIHLLNSFTFSPLVNLPTRITDSCNKCIDHIWTNSLGSFESGVIPHKITDHYSVFVECPLVLNRKLISIKYHDCSHERVELLKSKLGEFCDMFDTYDNLGISARTRVFCDEFTRLYNECCPVVSKSISFKRFNKPWLTSNILDRINEKHRLFRLYKRGVVSFDVYSNMNNLVSKILKRAKLNYYRNRFSSYMGNSSKSWKLINSMINKRGNCHDIVLEVDNERVCDSAGVAGVFGDYFGCVASNLNSIIPHTNQSPMEHMQPPLSRTFFAFPASNRELFKLIATFPSKGSYLGNVPIFIYKLCADIITPIIVNLFNASLVVGEFPSCLKVGRIIPVFKKGSRSSVSNYRPITTLPVLSKIFEKLMHVRIYSFLNKYDVFCRKQFGFREGHSTTDALLEYCNEVYNSLNESNYFFTIFLDFSRAFDTVNLELLLRKLDHVGIRGVTLNWFRTFLFGRQQYVSVDGFSSNLRNVAIGVPQGSTLGPLLFILYINDLHLVINHCNVVHFADDTTVYYSNSDYSLAVRNINSDLLRIQEWLKCNRLSINVKKTNYMITTNKSISNYDDLVKLGNNVLSPVKSAKFLGVTIDDRLSFSSHSHDILGKMSRGLGVMRRMMHMAPPVILKSIFYSLIYCHVIYALPVWGNANKSIIDRVSKLFHRAVSLLSNNGAISDPYRHFSILTFEKTVKYFNVVHFHRVVNGEHSSYFAQKLRHCQTSHSHETRYQADGKYLTPYYRKARSQNAFLYLATIDWNELPLYIKKIVSLVKFKKEVKRYLLID